MDSGLCRNGRRKTGMTGRGSIFLISISDYVCRKENAMYLLTIEDHFASAHQLRGYRGKCENIHGHNWKVVLNVQGEKLNEIGLLVDFNDLKTVLKKIINFLDHKNLNEVEPFNVINPSSENIAEFIAMEARKEILEINPDLHVESVTVWESDTSRCTYYLQRSLPKREVH